MPVGHASSRRTGAVYETICSVRKLAGYALLVLALASLLPATAFLLFSIAIGLSVQISEPPLLFIGGVVATVVMFWGARVLLSPQQPQRQTTTG